MKVIKKVWLWSWLLTLPVTSISFYWGCVTFDRYYTFYVKLFSPYSMLYSIGESEFQHMLRQVKLVLEGGVTGGGQEENNALKTINLFVSEANISLLNNSLPQSGFEYVAGGLWDGQKLRKIKLKYRGDNSFHWEYYKKSMRIKTKKSYLFEGMRAFNLVVPKFEEKLHNYLGYQFAKEVGLIGPRCELVNVTMNGKLLGVYILVEKLEELTLRNNNLMPADLYSGELVGEDKYYGISPELFSHPRLWGKDAVNNHYPENSFKPLEKLVELVNADDSEQVQQELSRLLNMEAWGRFAAYETLTQSFHYDDQHNWRIYYDPYRRCLVPIVWDPVAWHNYWRPGVGEKAQLDILTSRLHTVLFKNGDFLRARHKAIQNFFDAGKDVLFLNVVDRAIEVITPALLTDPNIRPANPQRSIDAMQRLRDGVEKTFSDVKQSYLESLEDVSYAIASNNAVIVRVDGRQPYNALVMNYAGPVGGPLTAKLRYLVDGHEVEVDITGTLSVEGNRVRVSKVLIPRLESVYNEQARTRYQRHRKKVLPGYYELILTGIDRGNSLSQLFIDRGGRLVRAHSVAEMKLVSFESMYRIASEQPLHVPLVWEGDVFIKKPIVLKEPLIIRPGTIVHFVSGATLILRCQLMAEGTSDKPILFVSDVPGEGPWGALVLWGDGANGSRVAHCEFVGGSGTKGDLFEYTAMFSIHDVKGVEIENCIFRDSKITDDMVHAVYSEVHFKGCLFKHSLMDALDIDISEAVIERCHFIGSGNDAIDLMTSNAVVLDTVIESSGDKGASVGEGSHLLAVNNIFHNNVIGVQVKDGSVAALYNVDLIDNDHAVDAYKKNWRYNDGGKIYLYKSRIQNNPKMITADKKSTIRIYDSYIDMLVKPQKKRILYADTVDSEDKINAKNSKLVQDKKVIELMRDIDSRYWDRVNIAKRGALIDASH